MSNFNISKRDENPTRYDNNAIINLVIERMFKTSVKNVLKNPNSIYLPNKIAKPDKDRIWNSPEYGEIPYSSSNLCISGCAVYVFHQGLRLQRGLSDISIKELAEKIGSKGYYEPGKGTYHNLFDHFGLRRASSVEEIIENIASKENPVITVLVRNDDCHWNNSKSGKHFINIMGSSGNDFFIDDPNEGQRLVIAATDLLPAIDIAWIW